MIAIVHKLISTPPGSVQELVKFAGRIGVAEARLLYSGTPMECFELRELEAVKAAAAGAVVLFDGRMDEREAAVDEPRSAVSSLGLSWTAFAHRMPPEDDRLLLVTNDLRARNAYGEMSHVWLVYGVSGSARTGVTAYGSGLERIWNLTHWRYAMSDGRAARHAE